LKIIDVRTHSLLEVEDFTCPLEEVEDDQAQDGSGANEEEGQVYLLDLPSNEPAGEVVLDLQNAVYHHD